MIVEVADAETNGFVAELDKVWTLGIGRHGTDEETVYSDYDPKLPPLAEGLDRMKQADKVVFHNGLDFDLFAINKAHPGTLKFEQIIDTMVISRFLDPEGRLHNLDELGKKLGYRKMDWPHGFDKWHPDFPTYNAQDIRVGKAIYADQLERLEKYAASGKYEYEDALDVEHKVQFIIALQKHHGFRLDIPACQDLVTDLRAEQQELIDTLQEEYPPQWRPAKAYWDFKNRGWDGIETKVSKTNRKPYVKDTARTPVKLEVFNPGSRQQVAQRLSAEHKWTPRKKTDTGQPSVDDEVLQDLAVIIPAAKNIARYYRVKKLLGQIADGDNAWLKLEKNGRIHGQVNTMGARTYRMSHYAPNCAQVDKKDLRMRAVWLSDEGEVLVGSDGESLELCCLAHRLFTWDGGKFGEAVVSGSKEDGTDPHTLNMKIVGLYKRDNAKTVIYALIYGGGDVKLGIIIIQDADEAEKPRPKGAPRTIGKEARSRLETGITGFDKLVKACKKRHKKFRAIRGLDGRKVKSVSEHSALNTLLQSDGAIIMKKALAVFHFELMPEVGLVDPKTWLPTGLGWKLNWEQALFNYCANVHDEVQMTTAEERAELLGQKFSEAITIAGTRLGVNCPLSGSYDIGANWKDTH